MRPYSHETNIGRTIAGHDVHHKTSSGTRKDSKAASKPLKHAARQEGKKQASGMKP